jgi:hypothetical protein
MPLIEFERLIDESVLKRGRTYYNKNLVTQCEEIANGKYEAVVAGTEDYTVQISLTDGIISECICVCPYDMGPICKHIVAVCFHLRQGGPNPKKHAARSTKSRKPAKRKTMADQVNELLEKITLDELKQFTSEVVLPDRSLREIFLSSFATHDSGGSKAFYVKRVKAILRSASDRHGFIGWHSSGRVWADVSRMLDSAQKHIEKQDFMSGIYTSTAVMEQIAAALQYADDSNGSLGDCVRSAFDMLCEITSLSLPEKPRLHLINYCFTTFDKKVYEGWDWHTGMLDLASRLLGTEEELLLLLARTKAAKRSDYEVEEAERITYQALLKIRGEREAQSYLEQHISNPCLRRKAIENDLQKRRYEYARSVALDGVEYDQEKRRGLVQEWYDWLLKIAQAQNDCENIIDHARKLYIDGFRHEQDYYGLMKQHVAPDRWANFVEELIGDVAAKSWGYPAGRIAEIYVREGWYDRLLEMLKTSPSLESLERYEKYLKRDYADELAMLYADAVIKFVRDNTGRQYYKTAAKYLRRIKKLGSPEKASEIVETLRSEYPQRRALQEELDSV